MLSQVTELIVDEQFRGPMCQAPYPGHPRGCPNYNKKRGCPPNSPKLYDLFCATGPFYLIYTEFNLNAHVAKMKARHPKWSRRQLYCCLYWQNTARARLREEIARFIRLSPGHKVTACPEAMGLNVTATMEYAGLPVPEWPVKTRAFQVALAGIPG
jgi:hypothetical protein